jgi:hypothetical protein
MRDRLRALKPYAELALRHPLHLIAAYAAALIAEVLLTIQPLFLRAFIDGAGAGLRARDLWPFPAFMLAAAALTYAFDFISVAIRYILQRRIERGLKEVYLDYGGERRAEAARFALGSGIGRLASLSLSLSVDFLLVLSRAGLILAFLSLDNPALGGLTVLVLAAGLAVNAASTARLGRLSRAAERGTGAVVARARAGGAASAKSGLDRVHRYDLAQFSLRSANVAVSFFVFRVLPLSVLAWYLLGRGGSLGSLASTFLYFSMLRGPFSELTSLLQDSVVAFSESGLFRGELERALVLERLFAQLPRGMIWERSARRQGLALSTAARAEPGAREFYDDLSGAEKDAALDLLRRRSKTLSLCVYSEDAAVARHAHFVHHGEGAVRTVLTEAAA